MKLPAGRNVEFEGKMLPLGSSWAFTLVYCVFSFGMFWLSVTVIREFIFILIIGFFAAWGVAYLYFAMRATLDVRRFGAMRLRANLPRATVGGSLSATLRVSEAAELRGTVRAELRCNHLSFDDKRKRNEETVWAEERRFPIQRGTRGSYALIAFEIPDGLAPSELPREGGLETGRKYGRWELQAVAESDGAYRDEAYTLEVLPPKPGQAPSKAVQRPLPPTIAQPGAAAPGAPAAPARKPKPMEEASAAVAEPALAPAPPDRVVLWILVAANLVPLAGAAFWGWRVHEVVFMYWLENLVIGAFNILRIVAAEPTLEPEDAGASLFGAKLALIGFFMVHYGVFCYGHGEALIAMFPPEAGGYERSLGSAVARMLRDPLVMAGLLALIASHGTSFFRNYLGRGEYQGADVGEMMTRPYKRIFVTHIFIIFGAFVLLGLSSPLAAMLLFVAIKIGFDIHFHRREHASAPGRDGTH